jgi:hypothetical protein
VAVTVKDPGVVPEAGDTESQFPPLLVKPVTLYGNTVLPSLLVTFMVCVAEPPDGLLRMRLFVDGTKVGCPVMVSVTGTTVVVPTPMPDKVRVPVYVPGWRAPGEMLTLTFPGIVPDEGVATSQLMPVVETVATAEKLVAVPILLIVSVCSGGNAPPVA